MEKQEAVKLLNDFQEALFKAKMAFNGEERESKRADGLSKKLSEAENKLTELKKELKVSNRLVGAYVSKYGDNIQPCNVCSTDGGFEFEGAPGDYGFEECRDCSGKGFIFR
jgi:hypothetical protein